MPSLKCFVSADTGPMHLAVAMNVPLVALFAKDTYEMGKPYPGKPCHHVLIAGKMEDIHVDDVASTIMSAVDDI